MTPRGLRTVIPRPVEDLWAWSLSMLRAIGSHHPHAGDDRPINSLGDKKWDSFTPPVCSDYERAHGVHKGQRYFGDVRDRL
jgi:hypothetical protein